VKNHSNIFDGKFPTRLAFAIISAPDEEAAMDLAFFGDPYFAAGSSYANDPRYQKDHADSLLYFNELGEGKELECLEIYYAAIKSASAGSAGCNYDDDEGFQAGN
jgi:hypothetical protein